VLFPNGLEADDGATWFTSLNAEPDDRFVPFDRDRLDFCARYDFRHAGEVGTSFTFILAEDVFHGVIQVAFGHGLDVRICRKSDRLLVHRTSSEAGS